MFGDAAPTASPADLPGPGLRSPCRPRRRRVGTPPEESGPGHAVPRCAGADRRHEGGARGSATARCEGCIPGCRGGELSPRCDAGACSCLRAGRAAAHVLSRSDRSRRLGGAVAPQMREPRRSGATRPSRGSRARQRQPAPPGHGGACTAPGLASIRSQWSTAVARAHGRSDSRRFAGRHPRHAVGAARRRADRGRAHRSR